MREHPTGFVEYGEIEIRIDGQRFEPTPFCAQVPTAPNPGTRNRKARRADAARARRAS